MNKKSSNINEGIKAVLFFKRKDFTRTKRTKSTKCDQVTFDIFYEHKKHKKQKKQKKVQNVKQAIFFLLDVFKKQQKAQKAHETHKNANIRIGDFLPLRCFLSAFKTAFFVFVHFYAFLCFQCVFKK